MTNLTDDRNYMTTQEILCMPGYDGHTETFISALNSLLSATAFLENIMVIVALQKVSSLQPPSKLLLGCLASTDLCVGLITQPIYAYGLLSPEYSKHCYYSAILSKTLGVVFCGVSLLTLTAVSVDRLLALLLGLRYRQVVTLRRIWALVVTFWLSNIAFAIFSFYNYRIAMNIMCASMLLCMVTSTFYYTKIYLKLGHHQAAVQDHVHQRHPKGGGIPLNIARYRKTVSCALWVQIAFVACYLPFGIVAAILAVTGLPSPSLILAWDVTDTLLMFNSTLNPFLYCWKMREVKQAVKDTIKQLNCLSD
ncbi:melanocyte-stimulating hormone receptor-like [Oculina patagonica]